jgi:hypothetical protein
MRLIRLLVFLIGFPCAALAQQYEAPVVVIATGSTAAITATMVADTSAVKRTNYLCGFDVEAVGGTAVVTPLAITGLLGGTMAIQQAVTSSTTGIGYTRTYTPCLPASAAATAISVATTAAAGATGVTVQVWGFQR